MKFSTKLFLGALMVMALLVVFVFLVGEKHTCSTQKHPLPSPVSVVHANKVLHNYDVQCAPYGDPPISEKELDEPGSFYAITFTQDFKVVNRTKNYMKFTMTCDIVYGPSREAEKRGITEQVVKPNSVVVFSKVKIKWPRAFKTDDLKKFHYFCGCTAEVVERPLKTFKMPFVPDER